MNITLVSESDQMDHCPRCDILSKKYTNAAKTLETAAKAWVTDDVDDDTATMLNKRASKQRNLAKQKCAKCKSAMVENYHNPRNVASTEPTLATSTDDTVYSDIKAKRPYTPSKNDAMDVESAQKVSVPPAMIATLTARAIDARKYADHLNVTQKEDREFYNDLARMFEDLNAYLKRGTVYDIKNASVFMTSLMGPMLYEIPTEIVRFITYGGAHAPLKSFVNSITTPNGGFDIYSKTHRTR